MNSPRPYELASMADESPPLSEQEAEEYIAALSFRTGASRLVGVELEWLVYDREDSRIHVDLPRTEAAIATLPDELPHGSLITLEPGGQVELSSRAAGSLYECVTDTAADLELLTHALEDAGLCVVGRGLDPVRQAQRVYRVPRNDALEAFYNRFGHEGSFVMCNSASVQVCVDAGDEGTCPHSLTARWELLHAVGPVLMAAFANSPYWLGQPTGWRSTRQRLRFLTDPKRSHPPKLSTDPRTGWANRALDAEIICVRGDTLPWITPVGLTFRDWLRGNGPREATLADLDFHLSTLFPPIRPRGYLEVRMIDQQDPHWWAVPPALVTGLLEDPTALQAAMEAVEPLWDTAETTLDLWRRAAEHGPGDPAIAKAIHQCVTVGIEGLTRLGVAQEIVDTTVTFAERFSLRGRCPADEVLEEAPEAVLQLSA